MDAPQSYENHKRYFPLFHFFVVPILALNVIVGIIVLVRYPSLLTAWSLIVSIALSALSFTSRIGALAVQDRLIALEERLRLERLLPPDLRARIDELGPGDFIALRFCDDSELPELTRSVLAGDPKGRDAIKRRIVTWRQDFRRV